MLKLVKKIPPIARTRNKKVAVTATFTPPNPSDFAVQQRSISDQIVACAVIAAVLYLTVRCFIPFLIHILNGGQPNV